MLFFSSLYHFFKPLELCKIFPQNGEKWHFRDCRFYNFLGGMPPVHPSQIQATSLRYVDMF